METENANLFMMCRAMDRSALTAPPAEYHIRPLAINRRNGHGKTRLAS